MTNNIAIIQNFFAAWARLDVDEIVSFFTPDGTYHNMPIDPVSGHDNLKAFIGGFLKDWTATNWDVLNIVESGNVVIAERVDRTKVGEIAADLPCCGVFEMEKGKIKVWRDYFDLATYMKPFQG